jgi:hypothetical protein
MSSGFPSSNVDASEYNGIVRDEAFLFYFSRIEGSRTCVRRWCVDN